MMQRAGLVMLVACGATAPAAPPPDAPDAGGPDQPPQAHLALWLDASRSDLIASSSGAAPSDGAGVARWQSAIGALEAVQATGARRPAWRAAIAGLGGRPGVVFDGSQDVLSLADLHVAGSMTAIVVAEDRAQSTTAGSVWRPLLAAAGTPFAPEGTGYGLALRIPTPTTPPGFGVALASGTVEHDVIDERTTQAESVFRVFVVRRDAQQGGATTIQVDDVERPATAGTLARDLDLATGYSLGADPSSPARFYTGAIAEVMIYNEDDGRLDDADVAQAVDYLRTKYRLDQQPSARWRAFRRANAAAGRVPLVAWDYFGYAGFGTTLAEYQTYGDALLTGAMIPRAAVPRLPASVYPSMGSWLGLSAPLDPTGLDPLIALPGIKSYQLKDEPERLDFAGLGAAHRYIYQHDTAPGLPFISVLPPWAGGADRFDPAIACTATQRTAGSYCDFVASLVRTAMPAAIGATEYALLGDGTDRTDFYKTLEIVRGITRAHDIGMMAFALVVPHHTPAFAYRQPTAADLRWQVFSALAYGAKGIYYYAYRTKPADLGNGFGEGMVTSASGAPRATYGYVQAIDCEVGALAELVMSLDSVSVGHVGTVPPGARAYAPATSRITSFTGTNFLVGDLRFIDGINQRAGAVWIVDKDHYLATAARTATFTVDPAYPYVYRYVVTRTDHPGAPPTCQATRTELVGPRYTLSLAPGEGALLVTSPDPL